MPSSTVWYCRCCSLKAAITRSSSSPAERQQGVFNGKLSSISLGRGLHAASKEALRRLCSNVMHQPRHATALLRQLTRVCCRRCCAHATPLQTAQARHLRSGRKLAFLLVLAGIAGMRLRLTRRCLAKQTCRAAACSILADAAQSNVAAELGKSLAKSLQGSGEG